MSFWRGIYDWFFGDAQIVAQAQKVSITSHASSASIGSTNITNPLKKIFKPSAKEAVTTREELSMDKKSAEKAVITAVDTWLTSTPQPVRVNLGDAVKARLVQGVLNALYPEKPAAPKPAVPQKGGGRKGDGQSDGGPGNPGGGPDDGGPGNPDGGPGGDGSGNT